MLTKEDKKWIEKGFEGAFSGHQKWIEGAFATKQEIREVRDSVDLTRKKLIDLTLDALVRDSRFNAVEASIFRTEEKFDKIMIMLDGFTGKVADLEQENKMGAITLRRHGTQIHELATATGVAISE